MKELLIEKYKERLRNLKTSRAEQDKFMTDKEVEELEARIRDVAEFIQDLKKL